MSWCFCFDGKGGLNPLDREAVDLLRRADKPVLYAVNKLDSRQRDDNLYEFYALGSRRSIRSPPNMVSGIERFDG